jgi:hypothetical protein
LQIQKEGAGNAEGVLRKLLSPRGQISGSGLRTKISIQKEGVENAERVL